MIPDILLFDRPKRSDAFWGNLTRFANEWRRTIRTVGGYWDGKFTVDGVRRTELVNYYSRWIGCRIMEKTFGMTSWEGIVYQLDLLLDGVNYRITLDPAWWHNLTKVVYTDSVTDAQTETAFADALNQDSRDEFGDMEYVIIEGKIHSDGADAIAAAHNNEFAWPRSRMVGGVTIGEAGAGRGEDKLIVTCRGFWDTLNWEIATASDTDTMTVLITALVGAAQFVSAGRIETNATATYQDCDTADQRIGDLIEDIIGQGDASGNVWQGGVYAGRKFVYEQAPTTVEYYLRGGRLVDKGGAAVVPSFLEPGFLVQNASAPSGAQPPGSSSVWDDPSVAYCDAVTFEAPNRLTLHLHGEAESIEILADQIQRGIR